jgi:hypothetical protein
VQPLRFPRSWRHGAQHARRRAHPLADAGNLPARYPGTAKTDKTNEEIAEDRTRSSDPTEQDKQTVALIEIADVDPWLFRTVDQVAGLVWVLQVAVFEAGPMQRAGG